MNRRLFIAAGLLVGLLFLAVPAEAQITPRLPAASNDLKWTGTRFYLQNAPADYDPPTERGAWLSTTGYIAAKLSRTKSGAIASKGTTEVSTVNAFDVLLLKMVSEAIPTAQTISGTLTWVLGSQESVAAMNAHWHVHVFVIQGNTDAVRGILYANYTEALNVNEWPVSPNAVGDTPTASLTLTPVAIQANDRIVIEVGYAARNTANTPYTGTVWYGGTNATDLTAGGNEALYPGYFEFSQTLFSGPLTILKPANVQPNDVMIASIGARPAWNASANTVINPPAAYPWTLVERIDDDAGVQRSLAIYSRVAGASEPSSYDWTIINHHSAVGGIQAFSGVDTGNLLDGVDAGQPTASGLSHSTPGMTTTVNNAMLVTSFLVGRGGNTWSLVSTGLTEAFDENQEGFGGSALMAAYGEQGVFGATGPKQADTSPTAGTGTTHILALKPCPSVSDATYVTANAQDAQLTVYWSSANPVVILHKTSAFGTETPGAPGTATQVYSGSAGSYSPPSPANGTTYRYKVFVNSSNCYSSGDTVDVTPNASVPQWSYDTPVTSMVAPGLAPNDVVIAGSNDGNIHGLDALNKGTLAFSVPTGNAILSRPAVIPADYSAYDTLTGGAHWRFNEGSGTTAADSNPAHTGTLVNGPTWTPSGALGGALSFNGTTNYVSVADSSALQFDTGSSITISAWVKPTALVSYGHIVIKGRTTGAADTANYSIRANGNLLEFYYRNSTNTAFHVYATTTGQLTTGTWHHVAATYTFGTPASMNLYVNGVARAGSWVASVGNEAPSVTPEPLWIGAEDRPGGGAVQTPFNGLIDDVRIYNRALSAAEMSQLHSGVHILHPTAHWRFDEGGGGTAADSSGAGTLVNSPTWTPSGMLGGALSFNGTNNYVSVGNSAALQFNTGSSITISAWVKPAALTNYGIIVSKGRTTGVDTINYALWRGDAFLGLTYTNSTGATWHEYRTSAGVFAINTWTHVAVTHTFGNGSLTKLYVNGSLAPGTWTGTGNEAPSVTPDPLWIGAQNTSAVGAVEQAFNGLIDDVRIYRRALSAAEVADLSSGLSVAYVTSTDNFVYAINTNTGAQVWKSPSITNLQGGAAVWLQRVEALTICGANTDAVFVGTYIESSDVNQVYALNGGNTTVTTTGGGNCTSTSVPPGGILWTFTGVGPTTPTSMRVIHSTPYVDYANNALWVTSHATDISTPSVWKFNVSNGTLAAGTSTWFFDDVSASPTPSMDGSFMYVGTVAGTLKAIRISDGAVVTHTPVTGLGEIKGMPWPMSFDPVSGTTPDTIIFSRNATVHSVNFDGSGFTPNWTTTPTGATTVSAPVDDGVGYVYVGDQIGKLHKIAISGAQAGMDLSQVTAPVAVQLGEPAFDVTLNRIYIGAADGHIYAFTAGF